MTTYKTDAEHYAEEIIDKLVGGRITRALLSETDDFGTTFFGFRVKNGPKQFDVWVQRDPEGNGEGFLAIEPAQPQLDG
jgi:hypothetical protein